MDLTEEQKKRIEESRARALALRASKSMSSPQKSTLSVFNIQPQQAGNSITNTKVSFYKKESTSTTNQSTVAKTLTSQPTFAKTDGPSVKRFKPADSSNLGQMKNIETKKDFNDSSSSAGSAAKNNYFSNSEGPVTLKCTVISSTRFVVEMKYFAPLIVIFKTIKSRQYDTQTKNWSFDLTDYFTLADEMKQFKDRLTIDGIPDYVLSVFDVRRQTGPVDKSNGSKTGGQGSKTGEELSSDYDLSVIDERLRETLLPFQREAVCMSVAREGRVLVADDMGLGKTLEALAVAAYYRSEWPLLIVAPASVLFMWKQQILDWLPSVRMESVSIVQSGKDECLSKSVKSQSVYIISYDMMTKCHTQLMDKSFKIVIMDESHQLKNPKTVRTKKAQPLLKKAKRVILLTGTPALSRPSELYTQLSTVDPKFFPVFHSFGLRYCNAKLQPWGWDYGGSSNLAELQIVMERKLMIRRLKKDVLTQLPSKYRTMVVLNPASVNIDKTMKTSHKHVGNVKGKERHGALLQYFHDTGAAKIKAIREYVLDLLEADKKFIIFAHHQNVMDAIEEAVESNYLYIRIDGRTSSECRNVSCELFQSRDSVRLAILSIQAANSGLNLSAASLVVFAELFWNPGILVQAEDRAHRIGQLDNVSVQYLVAKNTADDYIWPLIQKKLNVLSRAGLTKDNFSEADTHVLKDETQQDIMNYISEEFIEDIPATNTSPSKPSQKSALDGCKNSGGTLDGYFTKSGPDMNMRRPAMNGKEAGPAEAALSASAEPAERVGVGDVEELWDDDCDDDDFTALIDEHT